MRFGILAAALLLRVALAAGQDVRAVRSDEVLVPDAMLLTSNKSSQLLRDGRTSLLRFRLGEAESKFRVLYSQSDGPASAYYHLELSSLLKLLVTDRAEYYAEFYDRSDSLRSILDGLPDTQWKLFLQAESKLHRAIVRAKDGSYLRAAFAGRAAYRSYASLAEAYPHFHDGRKGLGLLRIAIGSVPGFYRPFLSVLGMSGTIEEGLNDLSLAADSSLFAKEESSIFLALYEIIMGTEDGYKDRLHHLYQLYPDSPLFAHLSGFALYSDRQAELAEQVLRPAAQHYEESEYFFVDYVDFFLADALFRQDRFQEAVPYLQRYLDNHVGPALKATASLRMGLALEMIGHRLAAESFYEDVSATREFDSDQVARRSAERLLAAPMTESERSLLLGRNAFDSGREGAAIEIFGGLLADSSLPQDQLAEAAYRLGRAYHVTQRFDEALAAYARSVSLARGHLSRWAPWSEYYAGKVFEAMGQTEAANQSFLRARSYPGDYDYHQALEKNVKVSMERLKGATS